MCKVCVFPFLCMTFCCMCAYTQSIIQVASRTCVAANHLDITAEQRWKRTFDLTAQTQKHAAWGCCCCVFSMQVKSAKVKRAIHHIVSSLGGDPVELQKIQPVVLYAQSSVRQLRRVGCNRAERAAAPLQSFPCYPRGQLPFR